MPKYTLDRIIDNSTAVLLLREDESKEVNVLLDQLPDDVKEGDLLELTFEDNGKIASSHLLKDETVAALDRATSLLEKIKKKNIPPK